MKLPVITDAIGIEGKKVIVRADIDVPLMVGENKEIVVGDTTRLENIWPTIEFLLLKKCEIVIIGHIGRPDGVAVPELSTKPISDWINQKKLPREAKIKVLENLRFDPREEANDLEYAKELSVYGEIYVNEAFAVSERAHASLDLLPTLLPSYAGIRLNKEVEELSKIMESPVRPLLVVVGGAKLETKMPLISKMAEIADGVIVGGKLVGEITVGSPIMGMEKVRVLRLISGGKDVEITSVDKQIDLINSAGTIVWNGPLGMVEDFTYQVGTRRIAELIANTNAYKVLGGGDTVAFVNKLGLIDRFNFVSSGGGSMLKFLAGEKLPGIEALIKKND